MIGCRAVGLVITGCPEVAKELLPGSVPSIWAITDGGTTQRRTSAHTIPWVKTCSATFVRGFLFIPIRASRRAATATVSGVEILLPLGSLREALFRDSPRLSRSSRLPFPGHLGLLPLVS